MAQQNSFDIVSQVDSAEIANALNQTLKEVRQRFDFKGSAANVVHEKNELVLSAEDETRLRNMNDILQQKLVRRGVPSQRLLGPALRERRRRRHLDLRVARRVRVLQRRDLRAAEQRELRLDADARADGVPRSQSLIVR